MSKVSRKHLLFYAFAFSMVATLAFLMARGISRSEAYTGGFNAGNIISDAAMRDYNSLSEADIQRFLKSKNSCNDTNLGKTGNNVGYYSQSRPATWHVKDGHYVCMADEDIYGESAAHIIWQAAQDYHISPKVLLVTLEKEQSLVRDTYPHSVQYMAATGYGCPDTAPCDEKYYGLKNQIRKAAELYDEVLSGGWTNYPVGWNYIQYNPKSWCGGSNVYIENLATSALYRYTPYQPGGDSSKDCGATGNINFYDFYTDWFGSTQQVFKASQLDNIYLADGTYNIVATNGTMAMDVYNYGTGDGTNIQISNYSRTNSAQKFRITRGADGFYTIASVMSGKVLDVASASVLPGANVQIWTGNGTCAQKWAITYDSKQHYVFRNACSGNALDVAAGAINAAGTNVQAYTNNNTAAQEWDLVALDSGIIADGTYTVLDYSGEALDVENYGTSNGTNVHIYYNADNSAQKFTFTRTTDGFYTIMNPNAGKVLDIVSGSKNAGANVQMWTSNNTCAQKWALVEKDGGYVIRSECSGNALDVSAGATAQPGANVQSYTNNGTGAQKWYIVDNSEAKIPTGVEFKLQTLGGLVLDVAGAGKNAGANIQIWDDNGTAAQRFVFEATGDRYYTIKNVNSGKVLDVYAASRASGANIQTWTSNGTCAQKWFAVEKPGTGEYSFVNLCSGKSLDVWNAQIGRVGQNVQLWDYNNNNAQRWKLVEAGE